MRDFPEKQTKDNNGMNFELPNFFRPDVGEIKCYIHQYSYTGKYNFIFPRFWITSNRKGQNYSIM